MIANVFLRHTTVITFPKILTRHLINDANDQRAKATYRIGSSSAAIHISNGIAVLAQLELRKTRNRQCGIGIDDMGFIKL